MSTRKKLVRRFPLLKKASLVGELNLLLCDVSNPPVVLTEEDLANPTPFKINQVYYACIWQIFGVNPDLTLQPSFSIHVQHPDLIDESVQRIQFFNLVKRLMEFCGVQDVRFSDIVLPDSKRTCRNLSAIINFIKFRLHMAREDQEQERAAAVLMKQYVSVSHHKEELTQKLEELKRQKLEEQEHEEELKQVISEQISVKEHICQQKAAIEQKLHSINDENIKLQERKAHAESVLHKTCQRVKDLQKQLVTSPEKLNSRLVKLQQEVEEMKSNTTDSDALMRKWESLATRAQNIPTLLKGLNEDMELLFVKTNKKNELQTCQEGIEECISRQKQALREASAKHQNLMRQLKLVEHESHQMAFEDQRLPLSQFREEMEKNVHQLQHQVHKSEAQQNLICQQVDNTRTDLEARKIQHNQTCAEIKLKTRNLELTVNCLVENVE